MLPRFLAKGAVNSFYFYDYDRQGWVTNEPATEREIYGEGTDEVIDAVERQSSPPEPTIRRRI